MSKIRLVEKLTSQAMWEATRSPNGTKRRPLSGYELPGARIKQLSDEDREIIKTVTEKDFKWRGFR